MITRPLLHRTITTAKEWITRRLSLTALLTLALVPVSAAALPNQSQRVVHQSTEYVVKMRTEGETIHIKAKRPVTGRSF